MSNGGSEVLLNFSPPLVLPREARCSMELVEWSGVNSFYNVSSHLKNNTLALKAVSVFSLTVASGHDELVITHDGSAVIPAKCTSLRLHSKPAVGKDNLTFAYRLPSHEGSSDPSVIHLGSGVHNNELTTAIGFQHAEVINDPTFRELHEVGAVTYKGTLEELRHSLNKVLDARLGVGGSPILHIGIVSDPVGGDTWDITYDENIWLIDETDPKHTFLIQHAAPLHNTLDKFDNVVVTPSQAVMAGPKTLTIPYSLPYNFKTLALLEAAINTLPNTQYNLAASNVPFQIRIKTDDDGTNYWSVHSLQGLTFDMSAAASTMDTVFGVEHTPDTSEENHQYFVLGADVTPDGTLTTTITLADNTYGFNATRAQKSIGLVDLMETIHTDTNKKNQSRIQMRLSSRALSLLAG